MSSIMVLESLKELFPQVDGRILKAASIEHANNLDAALEFILLDVIPYIPSNSSQTDKPNKTQGSYSPQKLDESIASNPWRASSVQILQNLKESDEESQDLYNSIVNSTPLKRNSNNNNKSNSSLQTENISRSSSSSSSSENKNWDLSVLVANNKLANQNEENAIEETKSSENETNGSNGLDAFVARSNHSVNMEFLEDFVNDAKSDKVNLVVSVETLNRMLREVVQMEEKANNVKEGSLSAGQETLKKVEELREMLVRARVANDLHSGEVYGERSILSTEARELQSRLVNLSEEKDKSLELIEQIRVVLEARLVAAEEEISRAEKNKIEKENSAREELKEQENLMNIIVEESKNLKLEAEQNSKLREFLVDRGRMVDSLQGEISVICEDITKLKEIVDGNLPMSKSILSTMSSLSSSSFSLQKSTASSNSSERETGATQIVDTSSSEKNLEMEKESEVTNGVEKVSLSGSSDGWELFEDEEVE